MIDHYLPGASVIVAAEHPRTGYRCRLPATVHARLRSGRYVVLLDVEGRAYRITTDATNITASAKEQP